MKKNLLFILPLFALALILMSYSGNDTKYPGGSPAGYTGSPGDGQNCQACHGGSVSLVEGWITSDIPVQGYYPGYTYTITVTVSGNGDKGFLVAPQDLQGNLLGTLTSGSGNKLVGGGEYVTQSSGSSQNPKVWNFSWTAPETGVESVTFYGAFTVNKPVTKLSTLTVSEDLTTSTDDLFVSQPRFYPNPSTDFLNVTFDLVKPSSYTVSLYSLEGRKVTTFVEDQAALGNQMVQLYFPEQLPAGLYITEVEVDGKKTTQKVVVN